LEPTAGARRLPHDAELSPHFYEYARLVSWRTLKKRWPDERIQDEFEKFKIYHSKKGSKFHNWYAAWMSWVRIAVRFDQENKQTQRPQPPEF
jgi:hypothetical protein